MKKLDYFLAALAAQAYRQKQWVVESFSLVRRDKETGDDQILFPYQIFRGEQKYYFYDPNQENEPTLLDDTDVSEPPFKFWDTVEVQAGAVENLFEDVQTNYGSLLANVVVLVYPFGSKIPFIAGDFNIKKIEKEIERRLTTDEQYRKKGDFVAEEPILVSEYRSFIDAAMSLEGYSQLCVPSATRKSMTRDPRVPEKREELLKKYEGQLHDPAIIAKIDAELVEMDREWIKGDLSEGFYHKNKSYDVVRKKTHLMHGYEGAFGQDPDVITNSLSEGWDPEKLPSMANSLREGSYSRGAMTALGGYATKIVNRMFQNTTVEEENCGSHLGVDHQITEDNANNYVGFFRLKQTGDVEEVTEKNISSFVGKTIKLRSPMFCKTPKTGFCKTCVGTPNAENDKALGALAAAVTSQLMNAMMKRAHGVSLKTEKYDPEKVIT